MRPRTMTLIALAPLLLAGVCLAAVLIGRAIVTREGEKERADSGRALTAGVILAGVAPDYGWDAPDFPYAETVLDGYSVIVLDQFINAQRDSRLTLRDAITTMRERGARVIFVSPGCTLAAEDTPLNDTVFPGTLILNRADRISVAALLPDLVDEQQAPSPQTPSTGGDGENTSLPWVGLLAVLITTGLLLRTGWTSVRQWWRDRGSGPRQRGV